MLQKGNMRYLSNEATEKDKLLKTQLLFISNDEKSTETERIWKHLLNFLNEQKGDFTILKTNFPRNTSAYANQGTISTIKSDYELHLDYVILVQLIPARNSPENITEYKCFYSKVKLFVLL